MSTATIDLDAHVADYLRLRRSLGFKLTREGVTLPQFVAWLQDTGATRLTAQAAITWAQLPQGVNPITWVHRLGAVRGFARYLQAIDPATEIPPADVFQRPVCRATPYLYSPAEVRRLIEAAGTLRHPLHAATYQTVIGLLAVTGLRIGEAIRLRRDDVDLHDGVLSVTGPKTGYHRLVPLHPSATATLARYTSLRDRLFPNPRADRFFVSTVGTPLRYPCVRRTFTTLATTTGLRTATVKPRIHDLRHTFVVNRLLDWYRAGLDPAGHMPALSTYLGHVNPAGTYWYLQAVPELMHLAARRLHHWADPDQRMEDLP